MRPSPRLLRFATFGVLVSLAGFWWPSLMAVEVVLVVPLLLLELVSLDLRPPIATVQVPPRASVGQQFAAVLGVTPRGRDWFNVRIHLETTGGIEPGPDHLDSRMPGRGLKRISLALTARRRGDAKVVAVWFKVTGRLGLLESVRRIAVGGSLRVSPNLSAVRNLAAAMQAAGAHAGSVPMASSGAGTEFDELRAYVPGMDSRSIDWKASARHRELRVRRYRNEQNQQLVLMLDNEGVEGMDHAIHSGLALARTALAQGDRVALQLYGAEPRAWVPFGHGARHLQRLAAALADVAQETRLTNPVHGARDLLSRLLRRSMVVVFTDLRDPVRAELLVEAVRLLQSKHSVVVLALRDPAQDSIPKPKRLEEVAQTLLRRNLAAERTRATKRVRAAGVSVIAVGPRGAPAALIQRYRGQRRRAG